MDLQGPFWITLHFLNVDDVRISQRTHIWDSTACYGDNFTFFTTGRLSVLRPTPSPPEMSTRNLPGSRGGRRNLTAICEPIA
jgi:hypothetical protein